MKKSLFLFMLTAVLTFSNACFAEDNIFDNIITDTNTASATVQEEHASIPTILSGEQVVVPGASEMQDNATFANQSLQSSLSNLESAEQDLSSKLQTAQYNFSNVTAEYNRIKEEKAALKKIVRNTKSQIKTIQKTKKTIQKTIKTDL